LRAESQLVVFDARKAAAARAMGFKIMSIKLNGDAALWSLWFVYSSNIPVQALPTTGD
jgi:hypothetical protein